MRCLEFGRQRLAAALAGRLMPGLERSIEGTRTQPMDLAEHIRDIPDFPKPGILFRDISPLLAHSGAWKEAIRRLAEIVEPMRPDLLAGIESRGFLVAAPLALELGCGFVMVRKRGKLPGETVSHEYELEYGSDSIEIEHGLIEPGPAGGDSGRPSGDRRHRSGCGDADSQGWWRGSRCGVPDRTGRTGRSRKARHAGLFAAQLLIKR